MCGGTKRGGFQTDLLQINRFFMLEQHGSTAFTVYACRVLMASGGCWGPLPQAGREQVSGTFRSKPDYVALKNKVFFFNFSFFFLNLWCVLLLSQMLFVWFYLRAGVCVSMWVMFSGTHTHTHIGFLNPDTKVQLFCWGLGWSAGFRAWKFVLGNVNLPFALWEILELEEKLWCFSVIF